MKDQILWSCHQESSLLDTFFLLLGKMIHTLFYPPFHSTPLLSHIEQCTQKISDNLDQLLSNSDQKCQLTRQSHWCWTLLPSKLLQKYKIDNSVNIHIERDNIFAIIMNIASNRNSNINLMLIISHNRKLVKSCPIKSTLNTKPIHWIGIICVWYKICKVSHIKLKSRDIPIFIYCFVKKSFIKPFFDKCFNLTECIKLLYSSILILIKLLRKYCAVLCWIFQTKNKMNF